jgi:hypothetical protein
MNTEKAKSVRYATAAGRFPSALDMLRPIGLRLLWLAGHLRNGVTGVKDRVLKYPEGPSGQVPSGAFFAGWVPRRLASAGGEIGWAGSFAGRRRFAHEVSVEAFSEANPLRRLSTSGPGQPHFPYRAFPR